MNSDNNNVMNSGKPSDWEGMYQFVDFPNFLNYLEEQGDMLKFFADREAGENFAFWKTYYDNWFQECQSNKWVYFDHLTSEELMPFLDALKEKGGEELRAIFRYEYKQKEATGAAFWIPMHKFWQKDKILPELVLAKLAIYQQLGVIPSTLDNVAT